MVRLDLRGQFLPCALPALCGYRLLLLFRQRSLRKLSRLLVLLQHRIQRARQPVRPLHIRHRSSAGIPLQQMILVRNVQRCQHRQPHRVDRVRLLCHRAHLRIHVLRKLQNVFRIRPAQVIRLVENLVPHARVVRVLRRILSRRCGHIGVCSSPPRPSVTSNWPPAPHPPRRSGAASSPPGAALPRGLCAVAPSPGAGPPVPPRAPSIAAARAGSRAPRPPAPPAPPCTTQSSDKPSLPAPENRRREPRLIPLLPL